MKAKIDFSEDESTSSRKWSLSFAPLRSILPFSPGFRTSSSLTPSELAAQLTMSLAGVFMPWRSGALFGKVRET